MPESVSYEPRINSSLRSLTSEFYQRLSAQSSKLKAISRILAVKSLLFLYYLLTTSFLNFQTSHGAVMKSSRQLSLTKDFCDLGPLFLSIYFYIKRLCPRLLCHLKAPERLLGVGGRDLEKLFVFFSYLRLEDCKFNLQDKWISG